MGDLSNFRDPNDDVSFCDGLCGSLDIAEGSVESLQRVWALLSVLFVSHGFSAFQSTTLYTMTAIEEYVVLCGWLLYA